MSLATKYRPKTFNDVTEQASIVKILERQIVTKSFSNTYIFCGKSGCGKTSISRLFANAINKGEGSPIEIDAASNNGVDNIRQIIENAKERSLNSTYKVIILDEAHMLTTQSWNALLKCIEEPPKYTIFIFCTTEPNKIPATIVNRCQKFMLSSISLDGIKNRLKYICEQEHFTNYDDSIDYIAKLSNGGMRDAIALLEKVASLDTNLNIKTTIEVLGSFTYDTYFNLTNSILDCKIDEIISIIETLYNQGSDLKLFIDQYLDFIFDLERYCIFNTLNVTKLPLSVEKDVKYAVGIENNINYYCWLCEKVLNIKNSIKNDTNIKTTIEIMLIQIARGDFK